MFKYQGFKARTQSLLQLLVMGILLVSPLLVAHATNVMATESLTSETAAIDSQRRGIGAVETIFDISGGFAGFPTPTPGQQPEVVIGRIVQSLILVIGVIFGLLVIYGGYLWMIARGSEELVKKAKGILETAVIGIILVVGAYAITSFVVERVISAAYPAPGN